MAPKVKQRPLPDYMEGYGKTDIASALGEVLGSELETVCFLPNLPPLPKKLHGNKGRVVGTFKSAG